jgi:hypothetical protein
MRSGGYSNIQLNIKASPDVVRRFIAISDA